MTEQPRHIMFQQRVAKYISKEEQERANQLRNEALAAWDRHNGGKGELKPVDISDDEAYAVFLRAYFTERGLWQEWYDLRSKIKKAVTAAHAEDFQQG